MYIFTERINNDRYILFFALSRRFVDAPIFPPIIYLYSCSPHPLYICMLSPHCFYAVAFFAYFTWRWFDVPFLLF